MSSGVSRKLVSLSKPRCRSFQSNENKWISLTNFTGRASDMSIERPPLYLCRADVQRARQDYHQNHARISYTTSVA
jgi:hypothetical protein